MKVLSVSNKKGGAGKTVVTALLAVTLSKDYKKRVLVMDVDEQRTLSDVREQDKEYSLEFPYELVTKPFRVLEDTSRGLRPKLNKDGDDLNPAAEYIESLREEEPSRYDVILVDMPGRTDDQNILELITLLDGILVPVVTDQNDKLSSADFLKSIQRIEAFNQANDIPFVSYGLQNKTEGKREEQEILQFCQASNIRLFNTSLRKMAIYSRYNTYDSYLAPGSQISGDYVPKGVKEELKKLTEEFIDKFEI